MYLRLAFWTVAIAYISFLFARFDIGGGHSSPGVMITAAFFGALTGFALAGMFANRVKRKATQR
jgi:membrane associated rhomboid family serine protease